MTGGRRVHFSECITEYLAVEAGEISRPYEVRYSPQNHGYRCTNTFSRWLQATWSLQLVPPRNISVFLEAILSFSRR